jgi:hypothetical protein
MTSKAAEKIIEALTQLMEGYCELQEAVENDYGAAEAGDDDEGGELNAEADAALVTEVRAAIEAVLEAEDYTPDELGSIISTLTDALEEIDPDVFEKQVEGDDDDDDDDDDYEEEDGDDYEEEGYEEEESPRGGKKKRPLEEDEDEAEEEDEDDDKPKRPRKR